MADDRGACRAGAVIDLRAHPRAGVMAARRRGVKFGRKVKLTPKRLMHARKLIEQGTRATCGTKIIGIGRTTLYAALQREVDVNQSTSLKVAG